MQTHSRIVACGGGKASPKEAKKAKAAPEVAAKDSKKAAPKAAPKESKKAAKAPVKKKAEPLVPTAAEVLSGARHNVNVGHNSWDKKLLAAPPKKAAPVEKKEAKKASRRRRRLLRR